jgi:hypothetical protein
MFEKVETISAYCRAHLDLTQAVLTDQAYSYYSLPLCVIDAVFSIGVRYSSTEATVRRFCESFQLPLSRGAQAPAREEQLSVGEFLRINREYGAERMAAEIYRNRQRTSTKGGILKAEAAMRFAQALADHGVDCFQDVSKVLGNTEFEAAIKEIPGQRSGVSLRYFCMLVGDTNFIKPDRMIKRFLYSATGEQLTDDECQRALAEACAVLAKDYPNLTPRALDNLIWKYQRNAGRD